MRRALAPLLALVLVAGCGGGNGERLSHEEFVAQADAICERQVAKIKAVPQPESLEELDEYAEKVIPLAKEEVEQLHELEPPQADEEKVEQMLDDVEATVSAVERIGEAAKAGDQAQLQAAIAEGQAADARAERTSRELGLKVCGVETRPV